MLDEVRKMMGLIKLDTLLEKERLHVIHSPNPEDHNQVISMVFSKQITMGVILEKVLYVHPDYFKGGRFHNVFYENEMNLVVKTYGLKAKMALDLDAVKLKALERISELRKKADTEIDIEKIELYAAEAESIAHDLQREESTKMFNEILKLKADLIEKSKPKESEQLAKIQELIEKAKTIKDPAELEPIMKEAADIMAKIPDGPESKHAKEFLADHLQRLSGLVDEEETEEEKKKQADIDKKNKAYIDIVKKADALFDKKKYKDANELYEEARDLKPEMKHPIKRLAEIEKLLSKK